MILPVFLFSYLFGLFNDFASNALKIMFISLGSAIRSLASAPYMQSQKGELGNIRLPKFCISAPPLTPQKGLGDST
jgi:hypothetical protein